MNLDWFENCCGKTSNCDLPRDPSTAVRQSVSARNAGALVFGWKDAAAGKMTRMIAFGAIAVVAVGGVAALFAVVVFGCSNLRSFAIATPCGIGLVGIWSRIPATGAPCLCGWA